MTQSPAGQALSRLDLLPTTQEMRKIRSEATVECLNDQGKETICRPLDKPCLFNIIIDPCEKNNLADQ